MHELPNHAKGGHPFKTPNKTDQMGFNVSTKWTANFRSRTAPTLQEATGSEVLIMNQAEQSQLPEAIKIFFFKYVFV